MNSLSYLPTIIRETFTGAQSLQRIPEPAQIMNGPDRVSAYVEAGHDRDSPMLANYVFHAGQIAQVVHGASRVVDLACGPGVLLCMVAQMLPETQFVGVDLAVDMLASARANAASRGLTNVEFVHADITTLEPIADASADAVISTLALHHLPDVELLHACFAQIRRIVAPNGAIYLADLIRPRSAKTIEFLVDASRGRQPELFVEDYDVSLRAGFRVAEFQRLARDELPMPTQVCSTFGIGVMVLVKTPSRTLPESLVAHLQSLRDELSEDARFDLDSIRRFFRMGGLAGDPFQ